MRLSITIRLLPENWAALRPSSQLQDRQFAGGPLVPRRYTIREHLENIGDPAGTTYPFSARYAYHANGTVSEAEFYSAGSSATAKRYRYVFGTTSYDALNRLKSADFSSWSGSSWTSTLAHDLAGIGYDLAGNITALQRYRETGSLLDNLTYSNATASNRLNSVSDAVGATTETWDAETGSFTYDANGNLKTAPAPYSITAVTYDHQNLPISLTSAGTTKTYRYNDAGQRITKQVGTGNTEVYLLDGATSLGVFTVNSSGSATAWHFNVLAGDKVVGRQPNTGNRRYYHTDLLGSTRAVVEGASVVESYDFEPWGLVMPGRTLAGPTKEGFTSKERDAESGLDYFGARYYMAALGRWTAVDPLADRFPEWNPYNYTLNNPAVLVDPDGQIPILGALLRVAAGAALGIAEGYVVSKVLGLEYTRQDAVIDGALGAGGGYAVTAARHVGRLARRADDVSDAARGSARAVEDGADAGRASSRIGDDAAQNAPTESTRSGIYEFPDQTTGGRPYVGQSGNIPERLGDHRRAGRYAPRTERTTPVQGGRTEREIAEHRRIQELTGGVPARQSPNVANKKDPIGPNRRRLLEEDRGNQ